jgi:hypothetical protein
MCRLAGVIPQDFDEQAADDYDTNGIIAKDPEWKWYYILKRYVFQIMNMVDLLAIVPFYLEYLASTGSSIAIIRILRLARMLRIFKASKYNEGTSLLLNTLTRSFSALSLLFFFTAIGVVLFGSLIYFMESGKFKVTEEFPHGAYMRKSLVGELYSLCLYLGPLCCIMRLQSMCICAISLSDCCCLQAMKTS